MARLERPAMFRDIHTGNYTVGPTAEGRMIAVGPDRAKALEVLAAQRRVYDKRRERRRRFGIKA